MTLSICAVTWSNQHGFLQLNRTKPPETPVLHNYTKNVNYKKHPSAVTITLSTRGLHKPPFVLPALSFNVVLLLSFLPHSLQAISALRVVGKGGQGQLSSLVLKSVSLRHFSFCLFTYTLQPRDAGFWGTETMKWDEVSVFSPCPPPTLLLSFVLHFCLFSFPCAALSPICHPTTTLPPIFLTSFYPNSPLPVTVHILDVCIKSPDFSAHSLTVNRK